MKINKFSFLLTSCIAIALFSPLSFAKEVALYEQPSASAKITGTIDLAAGIIPIFTPKDGDWVKVADPRNGNVGWIKSSDLSADGTTAFSFTQRVLSDEKNPAQSYRIIQIGNQGKKSDQELQAQLLKMQAQQEALQRNVNQSIKSLVDDMSKLYQQYWQIMNDNGVPVILPVMIAPSKKDAQDTSKKQTITTTLGVGAGATKK